MSPDPTSLDRLHDIVQAPPVPWWPPAPGWKWVIGFFIAAFLVFLLRCIIRWQRNRYRREALAELRGYETAVSDPAKRPAALASLAELLKRAAVTAWPRAEVAALNGPDWLAFLNRTSGTDHFSAPAGALLEQVAYDSRKAGTIEEATVREMTALVRWWLVHHRSGEPERRAS